MPTPYDHLVDSASSLEDQELEDMISDLRDMLRSRQEGRLWQVTIVDQVARTFDIRALNEQQASDRAWGLGPEHESAPRHNRGSKITNIQEIDE